MTARLRVWVPSTEAGELDKEELQNYSEKEEDGIHIFDNMEIEVSELFVDKVDESLEVGLLVEDTPHTVYISVPLESEQINRVTADLMDYSSLSEQEIDQLSSETGRPPHIENAIEDNESTW